MAGCCDHVNVYESLQRVNTSCHEWNLRHYRNEIASIVSGVFFFMGWWFLIYAAAAFPLESQMPHGVHACGVVATVAMVVVNAVSNSQVRGDGFTTGGCMGTTGARIWLFVGFLLSFSALIASIWVLFGVFVVQSRSAGVLPGVCVFLQNLFILFASFVFKFGRAEEPSW